MANALALDGATVRYGSTVAFSGSLRVRAGEKVALVGPSGAGKSTLLRLASGAVFVSDGTAETLGVPLSARTPGGVLRAVLARVGTVHQSLDLIEPLSALTNTLAGRLGSWSTAKALLSLAVPQEEEKALAALSRLGIQDRARQKVATLSGGEKQRVALARILVQSPELILADEPIAALDPSRARDVMLLLATVVEDTGAALLVSLHDPAIALDFADRVVGLSAGRVAFDAAPERVTQDMLDELYRIPS